jgi:uncharacterized membrane protein
MMNLVMLVPVHILAGTVALITGFVALYAAKGGILHRKSGSIFVYAMLGMCVLGFVLAVGRKAAPAVNVPAAMLTAYLVITGLTTVRPPAGGSRWLDRGGMFVALTLGVTNLRFGVEAVANGGRRDGIPAFPFLMFGVIALLASALDLRMILQGARTGASRLTRHLWRMTFALLIATMSFFLGQAKVIPKPIRIPALLALPVLAVLVTLFYWLWRVRIRRSLRGIVANRPLVRA